MAQGIRAPIVTKKSAQQLEVVQRAPRNYRRSNVAKRHLLADPKT